MTWFDCNSVGFFFFQTKKQLSSNDFMNRKYIINPNEIVFMCFDKRPLVLCYAFKLCKHYNLFQSFFHTILYIGLLRRIWLCANLHILVIWSFLVRVGCAFGYGKLKLKEFSFSVIIID